MASKSKSKSKTGAKTSSSEKKNRVIRIGKPPALRVVGYKDDAGVRRKPSEFSVADRHYFKELHLIIDQAFTEAQNQFGWTWSQLSVEAGLAYQTVANLGDRKTKYPQFRTIWRICKAIGWNLETQPQPEAVAKPLRLRKAG